MSKIEVINFANITIPSFNEERRNYLPYIKYGDNNIFPQELLFYADKSVTQSACLKIIKKAISGSGFTTQSTDQNLAQFLKDLDYRTESHTLIEKLSSSMSLFNGYAIEIIWNKLGTQIASAKSIPFQNLRAAHTNQYDECEGYYYNTDWERYPHNYSDLIPKFDPKQSLQYPKQILYMYLKSEQSRAYPIPEYVTAINYIACEYEISKHHLSAAINCFLPSNLITIVGDSTPSDEMVMEYKRKFNQTHQGTQNSGKSILSFVDSIDQKINIDAIQIDNVVDYYYQCSQECRTNIITANSILTPALLGLTDSNSSIFSNGDELLAAWDLFESFTIRSYQISIENGINLLLEYSGFPNAGYKITPFQLQSFAPMIDPNSIPENSQPDTEPTEEIQTTDTTIQTPVPTTIKESWIKKIFKK